MIYKQRIQKILDTVKKLNLPTAHQRVNAAIPLMDGDYMIKISKKNNWWMGENSPNKYLGMLSFLIGLELTKRKEAAKFKKEELPEVIAKLNNLKGFKLVKIK